MIFLFGSILAVLVAAAACFAAWPVYRSMQGRGRALLAAALVLIVIGIGVGDYLILGQPQLGVRALEGARTRDLNGLIALLGRRMDRNPGDGRGWSMLGKAYLSAGDGGDAAKAFERAIAIGPPSADLYSAYGEALVRGAGNAVPPEAEAAFGKALALNPHDQASRYFLGFAYAARRDNAKAIALWQSLVDEAPPGASYRQELIDRIAALTARGGTAPDIGAMVSGLATRLQQNPNDPAGWQRLIRAYAVLGDKVKAQAALAEARKASAKDAAVLAALSAEARDLKLE